MKQFKKPDKYEIRISVFVILLVTAFLIISVLSDSLLHTMIGAEGLKNINISIILRLITGIILAVPIFLNEIHFLNIFRDKMRLFARIGVIICTIVVSVMFFLLGADSRLTEQHYIKKEYGKYTDLNILFNNISDLKNDNYETYTVNNCYVDLKKHSSRGTRKRVYYYNYTANFYSNNKQVVKVQIGEDDYDYLKSLPYGFDTEITVYKKSGFLRSVKPSVDFGKETSYENFFTISISGDKIIYEKNVDMKFKNIQWCGFKTGMHNDIENALFGIGISDERPTLDADYIGLLCNEVCIYGTADGKYRRLSNILDENDLNKNSDT